MKTMPVWHVIQQAKKIQNFDHNETAFSLTGSHIGLNCLECHSDGFAGTPTDCFFCHDNDFNDSVNPNHINLNISTDCASCHTTDPEWMPALFNIHDEFYPLLGAHTTIASDCASCHNGDYNNTPTDCIACHQDDYDGTMDPDHSEAQFSTDCVSCHNETAWVPANFDHDGQYFPIFSGEHEGEWMECLDCHTNTNNFAEFQCINCHVNPETGEEHNGVGGYVYEDNACLACHPTGNTDMAFNHDATNFPLDGAHLMVDCLECHGTGYEGTPTDCYSCHSDDYDGSINPSHTNLGLSTDCMQCHSTDPDWMPASFDVHNDYYAFTGSTCHDLKRLCDLSQR